MSNERDQPGKQLLAALMSRGLLNIGPIDSGVLFAMPKLVYWDCREKEVKIFLNKKRVIVLDEKMSDEFRSDLRALHGAVEEQMASEYLQQQANQGRPQ